MKDQHAEDTVVGENWKRHIGIDLFNNEDYVSVESLSALTGFPKEYIREELFIEDEKVKMSDLRKSMMSYLSKTLN